MEGKSYPENHSITASPLDAEKIGRKKNVCWLDSEECSPPNTPCPCSRIADFCVVQPAHRIDAFFSATTSSRLIRGWDTLSFTLFPSSFERRHLDSLALGTRSESPLAFFPPRSQAKVEERLPLVGPLTDPCPGPCPGPRPSKQGRVQGPMDLVEDLHGRKVLQ